MGCPVARLAQTWPKTFDINENGAILVFWLHVKKMVKNVQKGIFFSDSARSPHRTAKPSRGCLPLAHPRALPAVVVSDRRSPSAMCEFPFEWWECDVRLLFLLCLAVLPVHGGGESHAITHTPHADARSTNHKAVVVLPCGRRRERGATAGVKRPKAPAVEHFAWLSVGAVSTKTGRGSVSLI